MANPTLASGYTSGFTTNYSQTPANTFDYENYSWTPVQRILNLDYHFMDLPAVTRINMNILKRALYLEKITIPRYRR